MSGRAENMIVAGLDQDYAAAVETYDRLTPRERGELAGWLAGLRGDIAKAPARIREQCRALASLGFLETGLRWASRYDRDPNQ